MSQQKHERKKGGRPRVPYKTNKNQRRVRREALLKLQKLAGDDWEQLARDLLHPTVDLPSPVVDLPFPTVDLLPPPLVNDLEQLIAVLKNNIQDLIRSLPGHSGLRQPILAKLTAGLSLAESQEITQVSFSTLQRSRRCNETYLLGRATTVIKRRTVRVPETEVSWISEWLLEHAPVRSGSENSRFAEWGTWKEIHQQYCEAAGSTTHAIRSLFFVQAIANRLNIKRAFFDRYLCAICYLGTHPADRRFPLKREFTLRRRYRSHRATVDFQSALYQQHKASLGDGTVMIVYDYSRFHETTEVKVHDLGFVVITATTIQYFDYFADAPHDYHYTATAWEHLLEDSAAAQQARQLIVWSDGGLKSKENLFFLSNLARRKELDVQLFFFAPYHGHSLCDGHFGVGKQQLRRNNGGHVIATIDDVESQFITLNNTKTFILSEITKHDMNVVPFRSGIRCFSAFTFPTEGVVRCYERFGETYEDQPLILK